MSRLRIIDFIIDDSYKGLEAINKKVTIIGDPGATAKIIIKNASGTIIKRLDNIIRPKAKRGYS